MRPRIRIAAPRLRCARRHPSEPPATAIRYGCSPEMRNASRLVANNRTSGQSRSTASAIRAVSAMTCSQLSRMRSSVCRANRAPSISSGSVVPEMSTPTARADLGANPRRFAERRSVDQPCPTRIRIYERRSDLQRHARLTDTARTGNRDQPFGGEQGREVRDLGLAADKAVELQREVRLYAVRRERGRGTQDNRDQFGARADGEFVEQRGDVRLDGPFAQVKGRCDFTVGPVARDQVRDFRLPCRQRRMLERHHTCRYGRRAETGFAGCAKTPRRSLLIVPSPAIGTPFPRGGHLRQGSGGNTLGTPPTEASCRAEATAGAHDGAAGVQRSRIGAPDAREHVTWSSRSSAGVERAHVDGSVGQLLAFLCALRQ